MIDLLRLLEDMIENESFKEEVKYIIKNMFLSNMSSNKNLGEVLGSVDLSLGRLESATGNIIKGLAKEMLNRENSSVRDGINGSLKSIMSMLDSSFSKKVMSNYRNKTEEDYRNKTEDSASDFIRKILENDSVPEELKSELKALLDDFLGKRREVPFDALIGEEEKARNKKHSVFQREG